MNAVDYLIKPYSRQRFALALKKASEKTITLRKGEHTTTHNHTADFLQPEQTIERIVVKKKQPHCGCSCFFNNPYRSLG